MVWTYQKPKSVAWSGEVRNPEVETSRSADTHEDPRDTGQSACKPSALRTQKADRPQPRQH